MRNDAGKGALGKPRALFYCVRAGRLAKGRQINFDGRGPLDVWRGWMG
jgi:hypothetical protein